MVSSQQPNGFYSYLSLPTTLVNANRQYPLVWSKSLMGKLKINIDGAHFATNDTFACGRLIQDHNRCFIKDFFSIKLALAVLYLQKCVPSSMASCWYMTSIETKSLSNVLTITKLFQRL